jgi:hypothetical protein
MAVDGLNNNFTYHTRACWQAVLMIGQQATGSQKHAVDEQLQSHRCKLSGSATSSSSFNVNASQSLQHSK